MPTVSLDLKKQIKSANDIVDVVSSYIPVHTAGKQHKAVCPFHDDTRPSLQLDRHYQNFRCWACDAKGDVFEFVMRFDKVEFPEALRMLAERAGIALTNEYDPAAEKRGRLLDVMKWADAHYRKCLLEDTQAESARTYLGGRKLAGPTVRQFGLGYAPADGNWLVNAANRDGVPLDILIEVGLIGLREENRGYYDRFRDRVMFPIRDVRAQTVGFGGRILPDSPYAARGPKYYNSAETPLFKKSELVYGLDVARHTTGSTGYLAIVEGYTDVMMAHQCGITQAVATMGTALTPQHVMALRRYTNKVVLVFDGDEAGEAATEKALRLFWSQNDFDIGITSLPDGLDPCDLLSRPDGPATFRKCLDNHQSVLDFKLEQLFRKYPERTAENVQRIVDSTLAVIASAPSLPGARQQLKQESAVSRLVSRLGLRQETVWARLNELRGEHRQQQARTQQYSQNSYDSAPHVEPRSGPADTVEKQLIQLLLVEPALLVEAHQNIPLERIQHSGLRRILSEMYALHESGQLADLDGLRIRLMDRTDLLEHAVQFQFIGRQMNDRADWLKRITKWFHDQDAHSDKKAMKDQLASGVDDQSALNLLKQLQERTPRGKKPSIE